MFWFRSDLLVVSAWHGRVGVLHLGTGFMSARRCGNVPSNRVASTAARTP